MKITINIGILKY